jgi:exonuclease SbcC
MKPIRIEMRAFSCYADRQVIDFTELGEGKLFLIHGPTGSGKSTLLDAMSFALYGESSGDERKPMELRSHLADATEETSVTFEFAVGAKRYRVQRSPEQENQGKRGAVRRFETRATLWDQSDIVDDSEGAVLATKPRSVNEKIIEILGFSAEQFRQLIVIPQGQFRRLLLADVRERKGILETLFQASEYRAIEWRLKERATALSRDIKTERDKRDGLLEHHRVESQQQVLDKMSALTEAGGEIHARQEELKRRIEKQKKLEVEAAETDSKFAERDKAVAAVNEIDSKREIISDLEKRVKLYERAAPLISIEKGMSELLTELANLDRRSANLSAGLRDLTIKHESAVQTLKSEESRSEERKALDSELAKLCALEPIVKDFALAHAELQGAVEAAKQKKDKLSELERREKIAKGELEGLAKREVELIAKVNRLELLPGELKILSKEIEDIKALESARRDEDQARMAFERESKARESALRAVAKAEEVERSLRKIWEDSRAAALANSLEPDKPCPVCGSTSHPSPRAYEGNLLSDEDMSKARKALDEARKALTDRDKACLDAQGVSSLVKGKVESLLNSLKELSAQSLVDLIAKRELYQLELKSCEEARKEFHELGTRKDQLGREREGLIKVLESAIEEDRIAREQLAQRQTHADVLKGQIPQAIGSVAELETLKVSTLKSIDAANKAFDAARNEVTKINEELAAINATLTQINETISDKRQQVEKRETELVESMRLCGIASRDELRVIVDNYGLLDQMRQELAHYTKERAVADDRLKRAIESLPEGERPNLEEIRKQLVELQRGLESSIEELTSVSGELSTLDNLIKSLVGIEERLKLLEDEYSSAGRISDIAQGDNALKMSYQSYVLASRLDDVLSLATARLKRMSRGRYEMRRSLEVADRRQESGLAIEILDHYSGSMRSVATLSGGESFLASLSLALGLADAVQAHAGGIQMETIFIDEGFGTLDPEALEMAFQALNDLQSGGRLVGVISHVPDLKEMIKSRLEVTPGSRGSRARFVVD